MYWVSSRISTCSEKLGMYISTSWSQSPTFNRRFKSFAIAKAFPFYFFILNRTIIRNPIQFIIYALLFSTLFINLRFLRSFHIRVSSLITSSLELKSLFILISSWFLSFSRIFRLILSMVASCFSSIFLHTQKWDRNVSISSLKLRCIIFIFFRYFSTEKMMKLISDQFSMFRVFIL